MGNVTRRSLRTARLRRSTPGPPRARST